MEFHRPSIEIGILLYPDVAFATVHGLTDMFTVATTLANERMEANAPTPLFLKCSIGCRTMRQISLRSKRWHN
jgi:transcriptional regulator GlxA family with amidase domain